tara:strand:+ start:426 stop:605 length:180 start_codon:yes stop_codon:yes gene_type:complete
MSDKNKIKLANIPIPIISRKDIKTVDISKKNNLIFISVVSSISNFLKVKFIILIFDQLN